jgi:pimeloyl-ACP methyl ester carboxylesterase
MLLAMVSRTRTVTVRGGAATYTDEGDGLPVLFLHGWGLGIRAYGPVHRQLRALGTRVVAPALPGFGGTPALPRADTTFCGYGDWVADFASAVGVEQAVVAGHSFGGGVAAAAAHRHPDLARALVLVNAVGGATWSAAEGVDPRWLSDRPWWDWGRHLPADVLPLGRNLRVLPALLRDAVPNLVRRPGSLWRVGDLARKADLTVEMEALRKRGLPVAAVWGARDRVIPEAAFRDICAALGADGHVVEGSHSWLLSDPAGFGEVVTNVVEATKLAHDLDEAGWPPGLRWLGRRRLDRERAAA